MTDFDLADLKPTGIKHRLKGPADYRGWVLDILTLDAPTQAALRQGLSGPHYAKHWTLGHSLVTCLASLIVFKLTGRAPKAIEGEAVLQMRLKYVELGQPRA